MIYWQYSGSMTHLKADMIREGKERIYDTVPRLHGWPAGLPIEQILKDAWEKYALEEAAPPGSTEEEIEGTDQGEDYISILARRVAENVNTLVAAWDILFPNRPGTPRKRMSGWRGRLFFERRFETVKFVTEISADSTRKNSKDWERIATEWNEVHPAERPESAAALKRRYNRAKKDDGIMIQIMALTAPDAIRKLADPQDMEDWKKDGKPDGKPHIRVIKMDCYGMIITDSTDGGNK